MPDFGIYTSPFFLAIMTLMEPYTELDERAALVQIWSQLDYTPNFIFVLVKWLVSLGAIAGLAASMFGSMFPMPRIGKNRYAQGRRTRGVGSDFCLPRPVHSIRTPPP